jgi:5-methyltetrahydropteroyltriglutamate--homocysteine methyltransferase
MACAERHPYEADASFDGGDLDCGNGLLLLIRQHIDPLEPGQLLEFRSTEISVEEDFPAWCRMTGNELVSTTRDDRQRSFLVCKGPLSVMGIGSSPRPRWMLTAIHDRIEGRLSEDDFTATAEDATRLAVAAQLRAGVDVVTDGEQRRDNYASFVGARLDNCQLIPLTDLLPNHIMGRSHFHSMG